MKFQENSLLVFCIIFLSLSVFFPCAYGVPGLEAAEGWEASADIARIRGQIPSEEAFADAERLVWLDAYRYRLKEDGTSEKRHRALFVVRDRAKEPGEYRIPLPSSPSDTLSVTAAYYEPSSARRLALLRTEREENAGLGYVRVFLPPEAAGKVIAVESVVATAEKYRMSDAFSLAGPYPIWEESVTVEIPDGMTLYWQGEGIGAPAKSVARGIARFVWSVSNQSAWRGSGLIEEKRPALLFSLHKGATESLKGLSDMARSFMPPSPPAGLAKVKGDIYKVGERIAGYMKGKSAGALDGYPGIRSELPESGPWTAWERTLVAGRWLENFGFDVRVYWRSKTDVGAESPDSIALWFEPVLLVRDQTGKGASSAKEIAYKADQPVAFGRQAPSLYGAVLYRVNGRAFERLVLSNGTASENTLGQSWRLALGSDGVSSGTLGLNLSGAWADIFFPNGEPSLQSAVGLKDAFLFGVPGLEMKPKAIRKVGSGYRMDFDVKASVGIVSGGDMLTRLPCAIPMELENVPVEGSAYEFRFPFSIEQNLSLSVPSGYRAMALPNAKERGNSKASVMEGIDYRASKGRLDAFCRWTVRSNKVDELLAADIREQLGLFLEWTKLSVPFRKK